MRKIWKKVKVTGLLVVFIIGLLIPGMVAEASNRSLTLLGWKEEATLNYLVLDKPYVDTREEQTVLVSIGDESIRMDAAVLEYQNQQTNKVFRQNAEQIDADGLVFTMTHMSVGAYEMLAVEYQENGVWHRIELADLGIEAVYGVNKEVETTPDAYVVEPDFSTVEVVQFDENGDLISATSIDEAIENATAEIPVAVKETEDTSKQKDIVIVLDPGHGGNDPGAGRTINGVQYWERDIVLKIATYCKEELEKYQGVAVYMTRTDNTSPLIGRKERAEFARDKNATALVSFHINATEGDRTSANGALVYYPNRNGNSQVSDEAKALSEAILQKLVALGLKDNGVVIRNAQDDKFADGTPMDYLGINRYCKEFGIPGILIEHAFVNNESDVANFLSSDEKLKQLGIADANGIVEYYNLSKNKTTGLYREDDGTWKYYTNGKIDTTYEGMAKNPYGWWYIKNGTIDETYTGMAQNQYGWWYFNNGKIDTKYTGLAQNQYGWWYFNNGRIDNKFTGLTNNAYGWWYVKNGKVDFTHSGMVQNQHGWWYFKNGKLDLTYTGMAQNEYGWWYYENGRPNLSYTGMAQNQYGWWYFQNGRINNKYVGLVPHYNSWWYVKNGTIDWKYTGMVENANGWWFVRSGKADLSYTGMAQNEYGWWYYENGKLNFSYTGLAQNQYGWWYFQNGRINTKHTGLVSNDKGWWYVKNGTIDWNHTGLVQHGNDWWYVKNGKLDFSYSGMAYHKGWWYVKNGKVDLGYTGMAQNQYGWWYYKNGTIATGYTGLMEKEDGIWYINKGRLDTGYNGQAVYDGLTYQVTNGKATAQVTLKYSQLNWYRGQSAEFAAYVGGQRVANNRLIWKSSNPEVATVDANGKLTGVMVGETMITCTMKNGTVASCKVKVMGTDIAGTTTTTLQQMVNFYNARYTYPEFYKTAPGAEEARTLEEFCQIYIEECAAEGIRAEVAFCQSMKETGFLQYPAATCVVRPEQFNFAGLDTTGAILEDGSPDRGRSYPDVRTGIRAHVQRLKAYAVEGTTAESLYYDCIDPDKYTTWWVNTIVGSAPYVEWLGKSQNPSGYGWATDPEYGFSIIRDYMDKLFQY